MDCGENDFSDEIGCYSFHKNTSEKSVQNFTCESTGIHVCEQGCKNIQYSNSDGFVCLCNSGFKIVKFNDSQNASEYPYTNASLAKRHTCDDIDECLSVKTHHCGQLCVNLKGTYECKCKYYDGGVILCEHVLPGWWTK